MVLATPRRVILGAGDFFYFLADTVRALFKLPFRVREFLEQTSFLAGVSIVPTILVTIPFCIIAVFLLNQLLIEIGAIDLAGAAAGVAVILEIGPVAGVLVVAGAGATAICADLAARTIREEIDALRVLGIDPIQRLVVPRVVAATVVATGLNGVVAASGLVASYLFSVVVQHASPGLFAANLTLLVDFGDFVTGVVKAATFGFCAGVVACYQGLRATRGPQGVGQVVNETVVISFVLLFFFNNIISTIDVQLGA